MKMKTGPKVLLLAILFVGFGYWIGRGLPLTWDEFLHPNRAPVAVQTDDGEMGGRGGGSITARRVTELEDRVTELERTVSELRSGLPVQAPAAPGPDMPGSMAPDAAVPMAPPQPPAAPGEVPAQEMVLEGSLSFR